MRRAFALVAAFLVVTACQGATGSSADVDVYEFKIEPSITTFDAGTVTLDVENQGEYGHTLVITDAGGHVLSAGGVIAPGETSRVSIDLAPGQYSFTCRIVAQDDQGNVIDHYEQGMSADVVVKAG
jgi:plastocyanin